MSWSSSNGRPPGGVTWNANATQDSPPRFVLVLPPVLKSKHVCMKPLALKFQNMWVPFLMVQQLRAQWVAERARMQDVDNPNQPEGEQAAAPATIPVAAEEVEEGSSASDEEIV